MFFIIQLFFHASHKPHCAMNVFSCSTFQLPSISLKKKTGYVCYLVQDTLTASCFSLFLGDNCNLVIHIHFSLYTTLSYKNVAPLWASSFCLLFHPKTCAHHKSEMFILAPLPTSHTPVILFLRHTLPWDASCLLSFDELSFLMMFNAFPLFPPRLPTVQLCQEKCCVLSCNIICFVSCHARTLQLFSQFPDDHHMHGAPLFHQPCRSPAPHTPDAASLCCVSLQCEILPTKS